MCCNPLYAINNKYSFEFKYEYQELKQGSLRETNDGDSFMSVAGPAMQGMPADAVPGDMAECIMDCGGCIEEDCEDDIEFCNWLVTLPGDECLDDCDEETLEGLAALGAGRLLSSLTSPVSGCSISDE